MIPSQFAGPRPNLLVIFPGGLGDFLCFLPTLAALRREAAGRVAVLAQPGWLELIDSRDFEPHSIDGRAVAQLFAPGDGEEARRLLAGFTAVLSWSGHGDPGFAAALRRLSGASRVETHAFRALAPGEHATDYYARCAGVCPAPAAVWTSEDDERWAEHLGGQLGAAGRRFLVIHPGSGAARKNWDGCAEVVEWWQSAGGIAVELAGPAEGRGGSVGAAVVVRERLGRVAALLRRAPCYLGNDSGISHLAAAVGTPGLALFGPASQAGAWAPRAPRMEVLQASGNCGACPPDRFCTHRLPAERVIHALTLMAGNAGSRSCSVRPAPSRG